MKTVFIAGPYIGDRSHAAISANIQHAELYAILLANRRIGFICPHTNSRNFEMKSHQTDDFWYEFYLHILEACDAVLALPTWEESVGARGEVARAGELGMPVFFPKSPMDMEAWSAIETWAKGGEAGEDVE